MTIYAHAVASVVLAGAVIGGNAVLTSGARPADATVKLEMSAHGLHGLCSGAHISGGYILTAAHCLVDDDEKLVEAVSVVTEAQTQRPGEILWINRGSDIALVKTEADRLPAAPLACNDPLTVGEEVRGVGHPLRVEFVSTWGRVSGAARSAKPDWNVIVPVDMTMLPGDSGGPIFNASGAVVGVMVGGLPSKLGAINFVVPASEACRLMGRAA